MKINKKAALELGINTIVVMVIAMVVIGAGVSFIRTFFSQGTDSLLKTMDIGEIGLAPDTNNPVLVSPRQLTVKKNEVVPINLGVYNTKSNTRNVSLHLGSCTGTGVINRDINLTSVNQTLASGESGGFTSLFRTNLTSGTDIICSIEANGTIGLTNENIGSAQINIRVTT